MPLEAYYEHGGLDRRLAPVHKEIFRHLLRVSGFADDERTPRYEKLPRDEWEIGWLIENIRYPDVMRDLNAALKAAGLENRTHSKFTTAAGFTAALEAQRLLARGLLVEVPMTSGVSGKPKTHIVVNPAILKEVSAFARSRFRKK